MVRKLIHDLVNPIAACKLELELLEMGNGDAADFPERIKAQLQVLQWICERTREAVRWCPAADKPLPLTEADLESIPHSFELKEGQRVILQNKSVLVGVAVDPDALSSLLNCLAAHVARPKQEIPLCLFGCSGGVGCAGRADIKEELIIDPRYFVSWEEGPEPGLWLMLCRRLMEKMDGTFLRYRKNDLEAFFLQFYPT